MAIKNHLSGADIPPVNAFTSATVDKAPNTAIHVATPPRIAVLKLNVYSYFEWT
jgi:hypothetical protein